MNPEKSGGTFSLGRLPLRQSPIIPIVTPLVFTNVNQLTFPLYRFSLGIPVEFLAGPAAIWIVNSFTILIFHNHNAMPAAEMVERRDTGEIMPICNQIVKEKRVPAKPTPV